MHISETLFPSGSNWFFAKSSDENWVLGTTGEDASTSTPLSSPPSGQIRSYPPTEPLPFLPNEPPVSQELERVGASLPIFDPMVASSNFWQDLLSLPQANAPKEEQADSTATLALASRSLCSWRFSHEDIKLEWRQIRGRCRETFLSQYPILVRGRGYVLELIGLWMGPRSVQLTNADRIQWAVVCSRSNRTDKVISLRKQSTSITPNGQLVLRGMLTVHRSWAKATWQIQVEGHPVLTDICTVPNPHKMKVCLLDAKFSQMHPRYAAIRTPWFRRQLASLRTRGENTEEWRNFVAEVNLQVADKHGRNTARYAMIGPIATYSSIHLPNQYADFLQTAS